MGVRQERRRAAGSEVRLQQDFDGGGLLVGDLDATSFTSVATAIETVAGPPCPTRTRPSQRAAALVAISEHALAGLADTGRTADSGTATAAAAVGPPVGAGATTAEVTDAVTRPVPGQVRLPRRPRPRMTVVVDLAQATPERFALLQATTGLRDTPTLSARLTETLASDARLLVQIADGRRPLAELAADDIPEAVRRAVFARDRGCRAPGCSRPVHECDIHHLIRRTDRGPHHPDNLAALCRRDHTSIDRHRWQITLDPATAEITWTHPGTRRVYRTVPHGTRPPPLRPPDLPLAPWEAPAIPPPPDDPGSAVDDSGPAPDSHGRASVDRAPPRSDADP